MIHQFYSDYIYIFFIVFSYFAINYFLSFSEAQYNPRRKLEGNVLTIAELEKSDTAVYQCNASNVHGYSFKDFYLNVLGKCHSSCCCTVFVLNFALKFS